MMNSKELKQAIDYLAQGKIIAYPTEAVYGLGCDPFNQAATLRLLQLKRRSITKGLLLVAASWNQVEFLVRPIPQEKLAQVQLSWPGPFTWIFPASTHVPSWIRGEHDSVALRVSNHPTVQQLCTHYGKPLVSTSANLEGKAEARDADDVKKIFADQIDMIIEGTVGSSLRPTTIRDALTGALIRA